MVWSQIAKRSTRQAYFDPPLRATARGTMPAPSGAEADLRFHEVAELRGPLEKWSN
jgi:hypothetical protein